MVVTTTLGPNNPTLAFELWIWNMGAYNDSFNHTSESYYDHFHYGRFIWIYFLAPLVASLLAGPLARAHCK